LANNVQFIQDMFEVTHNFTIVDHDADVKISLSPQVPVAARRPAG